MTKEFKVYFKEKGNLRILAVFAECSQAAIAETIQWAKEEKVHVDGAVMASVK